MRVKKFLSLLVGVALLFGMCACKPTSAEVCVTIYPIQYIVERIGRDYVKVHNLSQDGAIQTASINKNFNEMLEDSKVLFYIQDLEPYFDVYRDEIRNSHTDLVDLASKSVFYKFQRYTTRMVNGSLTAVESAYYDGDLFNQIDKYENDPMIWMDPISMISSAEIIRDYLIEQYPNFEAAFRENYKALELDLTRLDVEYQHLKEVENIKLVTMTPSFGVWQRSYGIQVYPVCLSRYGALPSEAQLNVIKQRIIDDDVNYIVHEPNLNDEMESLYQQLKNELGLVEVELSNLSSLSKDEKKENKDYLTIMYDNLANLEEIAAGLH